jgi:hypothetical protein
VSDRYFRRLPDLDGPAQAAYEITPSSNTLPIIPRALFIGTAGNVTVEMKGYNGEGNNIVTFFNVQGPLVARVSKVFANSTASQIIALY